MFNLNLITVILDKTATISRQDWAVPGSRTYCGWREPAADCAVTYVAALYSTCVVSVKPGTLKSVNCEALCDESFITEYNAIGIFDSETDMKFEGVRC